MRKIAIGVDLGTAAIKVCILDAEYRVICKETVATAPHQAEISGKLIQRGLETTGYNTADVLGISVSGYGKDLFRGADKYIDEISANAYGAFVLSRKAAKTVINIGGQDAKIIRVSDTGKVLDFKMNDKCAAGTGRFFEMVSRILDMPFGEFDKCEGSQPAAISSTCAVFAETEIVSLLARGTDKGAILKGINLSVARRICDLMNNFIVEDEIYFDGGVALNACLLALLEKELGRRINTFKYPQFTVAVGAAAKLMNTYEEKDCGRAIHQTVAVENNQEAIK